MTVPNIESIGAAKVAISTILGSLEGETRERVEKAVAEASPVVTIMNTLEALYANPDKTDDQRSLILALTEFAIPQGWHGINDDNRGTKIMRAMMRDLGQTAPTGNPWPDASDDPAPDARFAPQPDQPVSAPITDEAA